MSSKTPHILILVPLPALAATRSDTITNLALQNNVICQYSRRFGNQYAARKMFNRVYQAPDGAIYRFSGGDSRTWQHLR